eukprot:scaffold109209_cov45-Phaeocystis_antarctica.AAC.1
MENMLYYLNSDTPTNLHMEQFPAGARADPKDGKAPSQVVASAKAMQASRICLAPEGDTPMSRRVVDALAAGCVPVLCVLTLTSAVTLTLTLALTLTVTLTVTLTLSLTLSLSLSLALSLALTPTFTLTRCVPVFYVAADEDTDGKRRELPLAHSIDWRAIAFFMKASDCPQRDAEWLGKAYADVATLQRMSNAGREAFNSLLSFGSRTQGNDAQPPIRMVTALLLEVQNVGSHWNASTGGRTPDPATPVSNNYAKTTTKTKPQPSQKLKTKAGGGGKGGEQPAQMHEIVVVDGGGGKNIWGSTAAAGSCESTQPGDVPTASCAA